VYRFIPKSTRFSLPSFFVGALFWNCVSDIWITRPCSSPSRTPLFCLSPFLQRATSAFLFFLFRKEVGKTPCVACNFRLFLLAHPTLFFFSLFLLLAPPARGTADTHLGICLNYSLASPWIRRPPSILPALYTERPI